VGRRANKLRCSAPVDDRPHLARHELLFGSQPVIEIVPVLAPTGNKPFVRKRGYRVPDWVALGRVIRAPSLGHVRL
jgi:hypothetical protein